MDEEQYKSIVRGRLQRDDFIEDDGVEGYADNGMDDWGGNQQSESEEEVKPKGGFHFLFWFHALIFALSSAKKKTKSSKPKPVAPPPVAPTFNDYKPKPTAATENDFMASLLGNMENVTPDTQYKSRKRKPRDLSPPQTSSPDENYFNGYRTNGGIYTDASSDGPADDYSAPASDDADTGPFKRPRRDNTDVLPATKKLEDFVVDTGSDGFYDTFDDSFNDIDMDDFAQDEKEVKRDIERPVKMEVDDVDLLNHRQKSSPTVAEVKTEKKDETPSWLSVHDSLTVKSEDTLGPLAGSSGNVKSSSISALEEDGSLRFFWIDYLEQDGKVYFIGKLKEKTTGTWISCCITVDNLERNLFLLPRERKIGE